MSSFPTSSSSASSKASSDSIRPGGSERPRAKRQDSTETIRPSRTSSEGRHLSRTSTSGRLWRAASDLFSINDRGNGKRNNTKTAPHAASQNATEPPSCPPVGPPHLEAATMSSANRSRKRKHRRSGAVTDAGVNVGEANGNVRLSANFAAERDRQRHGFLRVERKGTRARNPIASVTTVNARGTLSTPTSSFTARASPTRASSPAPAPAPNLDLDLNDESKENEGPFLSTFSSRIISTNRSPSSSTGEPSRFLRASPRPRPLPRPPLRAVNNDPRTKIEDEFCDIDIKTEDPDDLPAIQPRARDVTGRSSSSHNGTGFQDWGAKTSGDDFGCPGFDRIDPVPSSWGTPIAPSVPSSRSSPTLTSQKRELTKNQIQAYSSVPPPLRVSCRIKPHEVHVAFWDFNDGKQLTITGRIEMHDLLLETYAHQSRITVRSYVAPNIRGVEHTEEPDFVLEYVQPRVDPQLEFEFDLNFGVEKAGAGMGHLETIEEIPSRVQSALREPDSTPCPPSRMTHPESATATQRKLWATKNQSPKSVDRNTQITTFDWCSVVPSHPATPLWAQYFSVPIPTYMFSTRETRMFQINASVSYSSKTPHGGEGTGEASVEREELRAPSVFVSVSHLLSIRELNAGANWKRWYAGTSTW